MERPAMRGGRYGRRKGREGKTNLQSSLDASSFPFSSSSSTSLILPVDPNLELPSLLPSLLENGTHREPLPHSSNLLLEILLVVANEGSLPKGVGPEALVVIEGGGGRWALSRREGGADGEDRGVGV